MTADTLNRPSVRPAGGAEERMRVRRRSTKPQQVVGSGIGAKVGAGVALILMAVMWLAPIAWALVTSFKTEPDATSVGDGWIPSTASRPPPTARSSATGRSPRGR